MADTPFVLPQNIEASPAETNSADAGQSSTVHVTISLGCATFPHDSGTARDLVKKADIALYAAKEAGRNAVYAYEDVTHVRAA